MIGRFIGKDGSMGFMRGKTYVIKSKVEVIHVFGKKMPCICIYDMDSKLWCPYQDLSALLKNWDITVLS